MSNLDRMLVDIEVEWKPLGEVAIIKRGRRVTKRQLSPEKKYPVYSGGVTPMGYFEDCNQDENTITIVKYGTAGFVNFITKKFWANDVCYCIKPSIILNNKFLFYILKNNQNHINSLATEAIPAHLPTEAINGLQIPIPPPEIQKEIVRILDTFSELIAALISERTARKQQYIYYRDQLLSFEEGEVEWKTLREVAFEFGRGKSKHRPRNDEKLYGGDVPFIQTGDIRNASHFIQQYSQTYSEFGLKQSKLWPKGTLCITIAANIAETSILGFDACFPDSIIGFVANPEKTSSSYVEYLLSSIKTSLEEMGQGSAQSNINLGTFKNLKLPFPPIEEQARIVSILDKFDTFTNSISEGLPKEIELRKKQFEYYRDILLTFPQQESV